MVAVQGVAQQLLGDRRGGLLSSAGPSLLAVTVVTRIFLLALGFPLIVWLGLGTGVQASQGPTLTDFWTAFYYSSYSLTTLGVGDLVPETSLYRILTVPETGIGFSVFTLALAYFMSVYMKYCRSWKRTMPTPFCTTSAGRRPPSPWCRSLS